MVVDPVYRQIFVLGRYLERGLRDLHTNIKSDFYVYDIGINTWTQLTDDTAALGGPSLLFDHQMCLDSDTRCIYVFGGQSLHVTEEESRPAAEKKFSGLYVFGGQRKRDEYLHDFFSYFSGHRRGKTTK